MKQNTKVFMFTNLVFLVAGLFLFNPSPMGEVAGETPSYTLSLSSSDPVDVTGEVGQKTFRSVTLDYAGVAEASGYHVQFTSDYGGIIYNNESNPITGIKSIAAVFSGGPLTIKTGASFGNYYTEEEKSGSFTENFTRSPCFFMLESFADVTVNITSVTITYSCVAPVDGVVYTLNGDHYEVTDYTGNPTVVTIPATYHDLPVTQINDSAFYHSGLTSITLPEGLVSIGLFAFYKCPFLTSISIPSTVETIGMDAFRRCDALISVFFTPNGALTTVDTEVFAECNLLETVYFPEGLTYLGTRALQYAVMLSTMMVPVQMAIGTDALLLCDSFTTLYYRGTPEQWDLYFNYGFTDSNFMTAPRYYYSATELSGAWRYVDGIPTLWS